MGIANSVIENRMVNIYAEDDPNLAITVVNSSFADGRYFTVNVQILDREKTDKNWQSVTDDVMDAIKDAIYYASQKNLPVRDTENETVQ